MSRVQPFVCPYCAEEDLRPAGGGTHHCRACDRRFALTFRGLGASDDPTTTTEGERDVRET